MPFASNAGNTVPVSHRKAYHQSAALHAARMIRFQYSRASRVALKIECVEHLRASLTETHP